MHFTLNCLACSTKVAVAALPVLLLAPPLTAATFFWNSNEQASDRRQWSDHLNWAGPANEYPHDNTATVYVSGVSGWDPILDFNIQVGALTIRLGGDASNGDGSFNHLLTVTANGGGSGLTLLTDLGSSLTIYGSSNMSDLDTDDLIIRDDAALKLRDGGKIQVDDKLHIYPDGQIDGAGSVEFSRQEGTNDPCNEGLIWALGGTLTFFGHPDTVFDLDGEVRASYSSTLIIDVDVETIFNGTMTIDDRAEIQINDHWSLASGSVLSFDGGSGDNTAVLSGTSVALSGTVLINSGDARITAPASVGTQAQITLAAGTTLQFEDSLFVEGGSPFQGAGQLIMGSEVLLELEPGVSVDVALHSDGHTIIAGSGAGAVAVSAFAQGATGRIDFGLCDPVSESSDHLAVTGNATLDGQLDLAGIQNCEPDPGDEFTIVTAAGVTGQFAEVTGIPNVEIIYGATSVTVRVTELCAADIDGDGLVDVVDLLAMLGAWGTPNGDVTGDGMTDVVDLLAMIGAWGSCRTPGSF